MAGDLKTWETWIDGVIGNEVFSMHLQRFAWLRMHEIIDSNPKLKATESYFWEWIFDIYAKAQAQAVRRQADQRKDVASLARIMVGIKNSPGKVTRDWFVARGSDAMDEDDQRYWRRVAEQSWQDRWGGGAHIDSRIVGSDLKRLEDDSRKVRDYVNENVAHVKAAVVGTPPRAPERSGELPTLNEVHAAIDLVGELFIKYGSLVTGKGYVDLTPTIQHDWEAVFQMPWIEPWNVPGSTRASKHY